MALPDHSYTDIGKKASMHEKNECIVGVSQNQIRTIYRDRSWWYKTDHDS